MVIPFLALFSSLVLLAEVCILPDSGFPVSARVSAPIFDEPAISGLPRSFHKKGTIQTALRAVDTTGEEWFVLSGYDFPVWTPRKYWGICSPESVDSLIHPVAGINQSDGDRRRRLEALRLHPEWTKAVIRDIRAGTISLGMIESQLIASWGDPAFRRPVFIEHLGDAILFEYIASAPNTPSSAALLQNGIIIGWTK